MTEEQIVKSFDLREAMPLYEEVKKKYFSYWANANDSLALIDKERSETPKLEEKTLRNASVFKSQVLKLYRALKPKFGYYENSPEVRLLRAKESGINHLISLKDAETLFDILTVLVEVDGITKYETKRTSPDEYMIAGLDDSQDSL